MGYTFISYSTKNQTAADAMREFLLKNQIDVWMAPFDIPAGSKYAEVINKAIKGCSCVVLILTEASQNSIWVAKEVERAVNYQKPIIPVQMEDIILNDEFEFYISSSQVVAVQKINEESEELSKIVSSVKTFCGVSQTMAGIPKEEQKVQRVEYKREAVPVVEERKLPDSEDLADILAELNSLCGLEDVKRQIHKMVKIVELNQKRRAVGLTEVDTGAMHMVFMGNAGTGKSTVARIIARIYKSLGFLPTDRCVEVSSIDLVGQYVGQTAQKTMKVVESALGGVLIIDEAYSLMNNPYSAEVIETLLPLLEKHRNDFVCIVAGYRKEMEQFFEQNFGLRSRFPTVIEFEDYTPDELRQRK